MGQFQLIPDFFNGRDVFITGGSGLIGKTLIEKILYSCSSVNKIFVLLRAKRSRNVEERLEDLKKSEVFKRIWTKAPNLFDKLEAVEGDVCDRGLGVDVLAKQERLANVSVIIHSAASVRFDDPLKTAVNINIRGTREILTFAETLKNLKVFFHISTTYCYPGIQGMEEQMYPPTAEWRKLLDIVDTLDDDVVNVMERKIIDNQPNTYTFSKNLSESLVFEYRQKLPIVIYRSSIMSPAVTEPFAGWNDNVNGPAGILMAATSGLGRTFLTSDKVIIDYNPIDVAVKAMIIAIRRQGVRSKEETISSPAPIYNGSVQYMNPISNHDLMTMGKYCIPIAPFEYFMWPVNVLNTKWFLYFYIRVILFQLIPSILIDLIIRLAGRQPIVMKLQRRLYLVQISLAFFMSQTFEFDNKNFCSLLNDLHESDVDSFSFIYYKDVDQMFYMFMNLLGARRYLLRQKDETLPLARRRYALACFFRNTLHSLFYMMVAWFTFNYIKTHYAVVN